MKSSTRLILFSSIAIVLLVFEWGLRQIPQQGHFADQALRDSLNQESIVLGSAVKASTQALKFKLLDVLKAEGNDHVTRAFQDSPFFAATLLEWDQVRWKSLWYSVKSKTDMQNGELAKWIDSWPLSKLAVDEVHFVKVGEVAGQPHFAILVPVRRPNQVPMIGVGIFPASQFGLSFSADESREVRVFTDKGVALALTHPAYLGASVKGEPIVHEMLERDEVSYRHEWKSDRGTAMIALGSRIPDSNLYTAIETKAETGSALGAWIYLLICGAGAVGLNWVLFQFLLRPLLLELNQAEGVVEKLRKQLQARMEIDRPPQDEVSFIPDATLPQLQFDEPLNPFLAEKPRNFESEIPDGKASLQKVIQAAIRSLGPRIEEQNITVTQAGIDAIRLIADPLQLQTAIEEILKNSIEAMTGMHSRRLMITGKVVDSTIRLSIEDTGCGIATEDVEKIFDPFFSTKDSQGVARGLGLNVARRVIEELNGRIKVQSKRGEGTRIEIDLPIEKDYESVIEETVIPPLIDEPEEFRMRTIDTPPPLSARAKGPDFSIRKPIVRTLD